MLTTLEAAKLLSISQRRVVELIKTGSLSAVKVGGIWIVDEQSVDERLHSAARGGRPKRGEARGEMRFTLMNRTHEVAEVVYSTTLRAFSQVTEVRDAERGPLGVVSRQRMPLGALNAWWTGRGIPLTRTNLSHILEESGAAVPEELVLRNLGLSLSDQYWIRPQGSGLRWEDINFFSNDFEVASSLTAHAMPHGSGAHAHPNNTSDGVLAKWWICENGERRLLKSGTSCLQEPYNEVVAAALHERLLQPCDYVAYALAEHAGQTVSACTNFLDDAEEFVPAHYVMRIRKQAPHTSDWQHYVDCCKHLDCDGVVPALAKMVVCDDVIANHDRHYRNFGLIRNVETLACRPAPIFDSGSCLWCDASLTELQQGGWSFSSKPFDSNPGRQLLYVDDFSWVDARALDGFVEEAVGVLSQDPLLASRLPYIEQALTRRVKRMSDIIEWS